MNLTPKHKKQLKAEAHALKPIVMIGNKGLTEAVINEINQALDDHELIKIRSSEADRVARQDLFAEICKSTTSQLVQIIGKIGVIYRKVNKKDDFHQKK